MQLKQEPYIRFYIVGVGFDSTPLANTQETSKEGSAVSKKASSPEKQATPAGVIGLRVEACRD